MKKTLSDERVAEIIYDAFQGYKGDSTVFMSAAGALVFGRLVGWQGVRVCVAASTFRKYEKILGHKFRELLPERTKHSTRLRGIRMADQIGKFWQALSAGMIPALEGKMADAAT